MDQGCGIPFNGFGGDGFAVLTYWHSGVVNELLTPVLRVHMYCRATELRSLYRLQCQVDSKWEITRCDEREAIAVLDCKEGLGIANIVSCRCSTSVHLLGSPLNLTSYCHAYEKIEKDQIEV